MVVARTTSTSMLVVLVSGPGLDVEDTATDELDWGGEEEVLEGEPWIDTAVVAVHVIIARHCDHEVHHDHHAGKPKHQRYEE